MVLQPGTHSITLEVETTKAMEQTEFIEQVESAILCQMEDVSFVCSELLEEIT